MPTRDVELAAVMRRMLEDDELMVDLSWSARDGFYIASIKGTVNLSEEEANAIEEVQSGVS